MGHSSRLVSAATLAILLSFNLQTSRASPVDPPVTEAAIELRASAKVSANPQLGANLEQLALDLDNAQVLAAKGWVAAGEVQVRASLASLTVLRAAPLGWTDQAKVDAGRAAAILERALGLEPPPPIDPGPPPPIKEEAEPETAKPIRWIDEVVGSAVEPVELPTGLIEPPPATSVALGTSLYVADAGNNRITLINEAFGVNVSLGGNPGTLDRFAAPGGIAIDNRGRIYIADTGNDRIVRVDTISGDCWVAYGRHGSGADQFDRPRAVALDSLGRIYVADSDNHRIVRIDDLSGRNWVTFGAWGDGVNQFDQPSAVMVDRNDKIVVADTMNNRIARFTSMTGDGWTTCCDDPFGVDPPAFAMTGHEYLINPTALAEDAAGRYYVTSSYVAYRDPRLPDDAGHRIVRLDGMTRLGAVSLGSFGATCDLAGRVVSAGDRHLLAPNGIAIGANGHLFISDSFNQRLIEANGIDGAGWRQLAGPGAVGAVCRGPLDYPMGLAVSRATAALPAACEAVACPAYQKSCDGMCVNIDDPAYGCSPTGCTACALANVRETTCNAANRCDYEQCNSPRAVDLDGNRDNGCEITEPSLALWLDASAVTLAFDGRVGRWSHRLLPAYFGREASTTDSGAWPTFQASTGGPTHVPSVRFGVSPTGGHRGLPVRDPGALHRPSLAGRPYTIIAVVERASGRDHNDFLIGPGNNCNSFGCDAGSILMLGWNRNTELCLRQGSDDVCVTVPPYAWYSGGRTLVVATNDGTTKTLAMDDFYNPPQSTSRIGGGFTTSASLSVGGAGFRELPDHYFDGTIYELIVYDAVIPPALQATMRSYLASKYGIP